MKNFVQDRLNLILMLVMAIVAVLTFGLQFVTANNPELSVYVVSNDELSKPSDDPRLSAIYKYDGEIVQRLWRLDLRLVNTGSVTLIGRGTKSNILDQSVRFSVPKSGKILDLVTGEDSRNIVVNQSGDQQFALSFGQWRPDEDIRIKIYLTSLETYDGEDMFPMPIGRSLIDGEVNIIDSTVSKQLKGFIGKAEGSGFRFILGFWAFLAQMLVVIILSMLAYGAIKDNINYRIWRSVNGNEFERWLNSMQEFPREYKAKLLHDASKVPNELWTSFDGQRLESSGLSYPKASEAFDFIAFLVVILTGILLVAEFYILNY